MIHQGQRLTLGVEPGQDGPRIHTDLDQLESDLALDGLGLIGAVNGAHPAFAEDVSERVPTRDDPVRDEASAAGVVGDARWPVDRGVLSGDAGGFSAAGPSIAPLCPWTPVASTVPTPATVAGAWDPGRVSDAEVWVAGRGSAGVGSNVPVASGIGTGPARSWTASGTSTRSVWLDLLDLDQGRERLADLVGHLRQAVDVLLQARPLAPAIRARRTPWPARRSGHSRGNRMTWTSSETLPAAGQRRQHVFDPLQGAEVSFRPGFLRDPEHLRRLGAGRAARSVSMLPPRGRWGRGCSATPGLEHPLGAAGGLGRRGVPTQEHRRERRGRAGIGRASLGRARLRAQRTRIFVPRCWRCIVVSRWPTCRRRPGSWRQPRVGQVGIKGTGDVDDHLLDDVRRIESCPKARVQAQLHHAPAPVAIAVEERRPRVAVTAAQPRNRVGRVAGCLVVVGPHIPYPRRPESGTAKVIEIARRALGVSGATRRHACS